MLMVDGGAAQGGRGIAVGPAGGRGLRRRSSWAWKAALHIERRGGVAGQSARSAPLSCVRYIRRAHRQPQGAVAFGASLGEGRRSVRQPSAAGLRRARRIAAPPPAAVRQAPDRLDRRGGTLPALNAKSVKEAGAARPRLARAAAIHPARRSTSRTRASTAPPSERVRSALRPPRQIKDFLRGFRASPPSTSTAKRAERAPGA